MEEDLLNPGNEKTPGAGKEFVYKYEYHVSGMHCPACELLVEKKIEKLKIVKNVNAVLSDKKVYLETESMQINAMASGNFLQGGLIMLIFALGTLPVLAMISFTSVRFSHSLRSGIFFKTAGFIVIFFAIFNFFSALVAAGLVSPIL